MFAAVVNVNMPAVSIAGADANSAAFAELQLSVNASGWVSPGPAEMLVAQAALYEPESSATVTTGPGVKLGGSFTAAEEVRAALVCVGSDVCQCLCKTSNCRYILEGVGGTAAM
jgi:hypothetical protein